MILSSMSVALLLIINSIEWLKTSIFHHVMAKFHSLSLEKHMMNWKCFTFPDGKIKKNAGLISLSIFCYLDESNTERNDIIWGLMA
jgi:hypothetical protein